MASKYQKQIKVWNARYRCPTHGYYYDAVYKNTLRDLTHGILSNATASQIAQADSIASKSEQIMKRGGQFAIVRGKNKEWGF